MTAYITVSILWCFLSRHQCHSVSIRSAILLMVMMGAMSVMIMMIFDVLMIISIIMLGATLAVMVFVEHFVSSAHLGARVFHE